MIHNITMEYNFILTDVMNTGYNPDLDKFLSYQNINDQSIEFTNQYYKLSLYNLEKYKRKFACIFPRGYWKNIEFIDDLKKRIRKLKFLGFKFIICVPWESKYTVQETLRTLKGSFNPEGLFKIINDIEYTIWAGDASWFWFYMIEKYKNINLNFNHSEKFFDFLYLNKNPREHRVKLFNKIFENKLLDKSLFSFTTKEIRLDSKYELPWIKNGKNNDSWIKYPSTGLDQDIYELPYNHSAYNIVSETHIHDEIFFTEKIWKPIMAQQIFIVHGKYHYLKDLRDLGFQTFGEIMDESYDDEINPDKRIDKIVDLCKWLKIQNWEILYDQSLKIRKYNFEHFYKKSALQKAINQTILGFFKFADRS